VAGNFNGGARRSEEEEGTGAAAGCPVPWQLLRRATESEGKLRRCGGKVQTRSARPSDGSSPASISAPAAKQKGRPR
jgi:hypothetical protein